MSDAFTAKLHPQTRSLLTEHQAKLFEWAAALGAPLHLVFPQRFADNIETLQANLITLGLEHEIYFAKKANKAQCFSQVASNHNIGMDVAHTKRHRGLVIARFSPVSTGNTFECFLRPSKITVQPREYGENTCTDNCYQQSNF